MIVMDIRFAEPRKNLRLSGYDYSKEGAYFITICTQGLICLFGEIKNQKMHLNQAGRMVQKWWDELNNKFRELKTDEFIVMPNHIHGIILVGADLCVRPGLSFEKAVQSEKRKTLSQVIQWFKTMTTNDYLNGIKEGNWEPYTGKLWQRNYFDHIIRNEKALNNIRKYIVNNPRHWNSDKENPKNVK
jgi:putative transposase